MKLISYRSISGGACVSGCPFGAIHERSQLIDILKAIMMVRVVTLSVKDRDGERTEIAHAMENLVGVVKQLSRDSVTMKEEIRSFKV